MKNILVLAMIGLVGCDPANYTTNPQQENGKAAHATFITKIDGCSISQLNIEGLAGYLYLSKCDNNDSAINSTYQSGKTSVPVTNLTTTQSDDQILEIAKVIDRKRKILETMSDEDKKILGIDQPITTGQ
jgi:hypothetical protein